VIAGTNKHFKSHETVTSELAEVTSAGSRFHMCGAVNTKA